MPVLFFLYRSLNAIRIYWKNIHTLTFFTHRAGSGGDVNRIQALNQPDCGYLRLCSFGYLKGCTLNIPLG